jgi:DNA adenine methylase
VISLVPYSGGKGFLLNDLLDMYYKGNYRVVVEPFGGSAKFLLNINSMDLFGRKIVVYNDYDKRMVEMFKAIKEHPNELLDKFDLLLISRQLFNESQQYSDDEVENGFRELYILLTGFAGGRDNFGVTTTPERVIDFGNVITNIREVVYPVIKHWVIENDTYLNVIKRWDSDNTFFYLDPPYMDMNYYRHNFTLNDFRMLRNALQGIKGKYIMNHTKDERIRNIFGDPQYYKSYTNVINGQTSGDTTREEWFYTNLKV